MDYKAELNRLMHELKKNPDGSITHIPTGKILRVSWQAVDDNAQAIETRAVSDNVAEEFAIALVESITNAINDSSSCLVPVA